MATSKNPPVPVAGWLADNWPAYIDAAPVIVNPAAPPGAVLAWCYAEVESLRMFSALMWDASDERVSSEEVGGLLMNRLAPLARVLESVIDGMNAADRRQKGQA